MSKLDEINLPIKRTQGETIKERLTENAYKRILPARYLKKNEKGEPIENQEQLFKRIAKNIALGDVPHLDETIKATEKDLRKGLKREKNPFDKQIQEIEITEDNIYKFSYDTIYPKLSKQSQKQIDQTVKKFTEIMEHLKFTPNCVAPTTTVGTPIGTKQITDIEKGENVSDDHGQAEVAETFDNGTKQMQTITTSDGYQVTSSKEHVFRIINEKGEYVWKQASKISPGDWMALQSNYISEDNSVSLDTDINYHGNAKKIDLPEKINSSLAQWLGLLIADGSVEDTRVRVAFDKKDPDLKEVFDELTEAIFGYKPKTREFDDKNCTVSVIPIRAVVKFLRQNGLSKKSSLSARIPDKIQKSGRNCISAFLSGLFEGDGSVETRTIAYYTKSSELASQVQTLLLGLGIESKNSEKRGGYRITIRKNEYGRRFTEKIGFISSRKNKSLERFKETTKGSTKIPNQQSKLKEWYHSRDDLGHDFYKKISQFIIDSSSPYSQDITVEAFKRIAETYPELWESPIADLVELDQIYKKVESIENAGYLDACDLNVPNRNTFVADGFVSHNSPTIMNAGDELQQLSACFVDSPEDDMGDIHQTVKEASKIFQCLTDDSTVSVRDKGIISVSEVEKGDEILQETDDGLQYRSVIDTHSYVDADTLTLHLENELSIRGTPNHRLKINDGWKRIDEAEPGDKIEYSLGWLDHMKSNPPRLEEVPKGSKWDKNRVVSNKEIVDLYNKGYSDYEIAEKLGCGSSTIQRRRSVELGLDSNTQTGRQEGCMDYDRDTVLRLYREGYTDGEISEEIGCSKGVVRTVREKEDLEPNGKPINEVVQPEYLSCGLAELVGLWVGDGSYHNDGIRFHVGREEILDYIKSKVKTLFDIDVSVVKRESCYEVQICSHEIKRWWKENFDCKPDGAQSAKIPEKIKKAPSNHISAFLRGYFTADGTLKDKKYPRLYSSSEKIIEQTATLLYGLGIPAKKSTIRENEENPYYSIAPNTKNGRKAFLDKIGFIDSRDNNTKIDTENYTTPSTIQIEITDIQKTPPETVYDITVKGNHQYITDGIISHNSGGGVGYAFWRLRPYGDIVKSTGGIASGPITFMRTFDQLCETVAQGGTRRGAQMGIMKIDHPDIPFFIHAKNKDVSLAYSLRLNDPDDPTHTSFGDALQEARKLIDQDGKIPKHLRNAAEGHLSNFNISVGVTDEFMEAVENNEDYTLYNPRTEKPHIATEETKQLYSWFDLDEYVEIGEPLEIPAKEIWDRIAQGAWENGEPGVFYIDQTNKKHSFDTQKHSDHQMLATNPCVASGTLVDTPEGYKKVEDIGEGEEITTVLGSEPVKGIEKHEDYPVYKVEFSDGGVQRVTENHQYHKVEGKEINQVKLKDLSEGDFVRVHQNKRQDIENEEKYKRGLKKGILLGDGNYTQASLENKSIKISLSSKEESLIENVRGLFGEEIFQSDEVNGSVTRLAFKNGEGRETIDDLGLKPSKSIEKDLEIEELSDDEVYGILAGLHLSDGDINLNSTHPQLRWSTTSEDLAYAIRNLALQIGHHARIASSTRTSTSTIDGRKIKRNKPVLTVSMSGKSMKSFLERTNMDKFSDKYDKKITEAFKDWRMTGNTWKAQIKSIEPDGTADVYDLYCEKSDTWVTEGYINRGCGEQPLEEYEACNLGHINLSTIVDRDRQLWDNFEFSVEDDDLGGRVEEFLDQAIDWGEFDYRIDASTHFLDNVVTMSDFPIEEIEDTVSSMRKIGLGVMGLAQLYIQIGVEYGGDEANEIARQLMRYINHRSKKKSRELASIRGNFGEWEDSKYADPTSYPGWFRDHVGEDPNDWEDGYPIRNHNTTTIAPTGCVDEETFICTGSGLEKIGGIGEHRDGQKWKDIDKKVVTDEGERRATQYFDNGFVDTKTIRTSNGFEVTATLDHKFRVIDSNGGYVWREAQNINEGDSIVLQKGSFTSGSRTELDVSEKDNFHHNTNNDLVLPEEMSPGLAEILGIYMGDGYIHERNSIKIAIDSSQERLLEYLKEKIADVFGVDINIEDRDTRYIVSFGGRHLPRYFIDNGWDKNKGNKGQGSASAFIPDQILSSDRKCVEAFIKGLFEADGTASRKVELSTVSSTLAKQVQTTLLSLGHVFAIDEIKNNDLGDGHYGDRDRYLIRGVNRYEDKKFLDDIGFITKDTTITLTNQSYKNDTFPPTCIENVRNTDRYEDIDSKVKHRINQSKINGNLTRRSVEIVEKQTNTEITFADDLRLKDVYIDEVSIVEDSQAYTYDISVPSNRTYIANGFVSHNTTSMIGNTTGGCEPMYNVAYFKNVTQDVQGEEMLVEFDDYFLRVLEVNDIDVDEVKKEAREKMDSGDFDGVDDLDSVPDEIKNLFVVAGDLSGKEHARVQCALQEGVDSAISKCVAEGTMIQTDSGVRAIEEFADVSDDKLEPDTFYDVREDISIDGVSVESMYYAGEKPSTKVRFDSGVELTGASETHRVKTPEGWKLLSELQEGDLVFTEFKERHGMGGEEIPYTTEYNTSSNNYILPPCMTPEFARFLGMLVADGGIRDDVGTVYITSSNEKVIEEASEMMENLFDATPTTQTDDRFGDSRDTVYTVSFHSKTIASALESLLQGRTARTKRVPREIRVGNAEEKRQFINGVTLDGYISGQALVVYEGMSEDLVRDIAELLRSFGKPSIYIGEKYVSESDEYAYGVHVSGDLQDEFTPIEDHKQVDTIEKRTRYYVPDGGVDKTEYYSRSTAYYAARDFERRETDFMFDQTLETLELDVSELTPVVKVTDVETVGTEELYDIELAEPPHEYTSNGIISHNTCNFPSDASVEDIKEVYRYIYDNGGKGVTVYRDGSRSKQVLTTGSGSDVVDEGSVVEKMKQLIESGELELKDFLEGLDVDVSNGEQLKQELELEQQDVNIDKEGGLESGSGSGSDSGSGSGGDVVSGSIATPEDRPLVLSGETYKVKAPASELEGNTNVYVTVNDKVGSPFEVFISVGKSGSFLESYTEAIGRLISLYLRSGGSAQEVVDQLKSIKSPEIAYDKIVTESDKESQKRVFSVPDAIAKAIDYHIKTGGTKQVNLQSIPDKKSKKDEKTKREEVNEKVGEDEGEDTSLDDDVGREDSTPRCPECGAKLVMSEGCMKCPDGCVSKC